MDSNNNLKCKMCNSKNLELLKKLYGEQKIQINNAGHFSHLYNKDFYKRSLIKYLIEK